jgi:hypothetical protein
MARPKKRNSDYFRDRLRKEDPALYSEVIAGRMTVNKAAIEAGIRKAPSRLANLKSTWSRATKEERRDFLRWLKSSSAAGLKPGSATAPTPSMTPLVDGDGYLHRDVVNLVRCLLGVRQKTVADFAEELGLSRLDPRTKGVLDRRNRAMPEMVGPLKKWLSDWNNLIPGPK